MGCNAREKSIRSGRKSRHSGKPLADGAHPVGQIDGSPVAPNPSLSTEADPNNLGCDPNLSLNLNPKSNPSVLDDPGCGYYTEEQLEEFLLKNLDFVYKEALSRLVSLGYDEVLALRAILCNGHCYGSLDALSNILHNATAYLNAPPHELGGGGCACSPAPSSAFSNLRHLQEYSLAGMVCLLQQVRPHLTRGDAMLCLFLSDLHVGRASTIDIPSLAGADFSPSSLHRFPTAAGSCGDSPLGCPKRFDLPQSMKPLLKRNAPISAGGCHLSARSLSGSASEQQQHSEDGSAAAPPVKGYQDPDIVASVMKSLESMSIEENDTAPDGVEDHKKGMILDLIRQIRELEVQLNERREWAQQKAMQAARKLSSDLTQLTLLRTEREENQRVKKGKQAQEDSTMKRLSEMESALKKASGQVDRANLAVRGMETENAEIRAEMEASKLSASESVKTCLEVEKREKKYLKRLSVQGKQSEKLQKEIAEERRKIAQLQQQSNELQEAQKETEMKWRQEMKAKEVAISQVEEERRAKEAADASIKRKHEVLRQKMELDCQRHQDDIQRLEEDLSRLQAIAGSAQLTNPASNNLGSVDIDTAKPQAFNKPQEVRKINRNRECVLCAQDESSVVLLPCAHQVLCAGCNEEQEKQAETTCPCCKAHIEERIHVYGSASS